MPGEEVPWPSPPREPGPWNGGPPVSPPGNTPLPPLPGAGTVMHNASPQTNPWANPGASASPVPAPTPGAWGNQRPIPQVNIPPERQDPFPGLPTGPKLVDRAPVWILIASAIVVIGLIAGIGYVAVKGGRQYPSQWDARVVPITKWVEKERELTFKHPVKVNFLSDKEYTKRSTEGSSSDTPESKQYYKDQVAQLRALGFISGDVDLAEANKTLSDSGTLAYYDPDVEQVFVRGTKLTPGVQVTLAHELTHVLQDQYFDLGRIQDYDDGRAAVLRALGEGDATKVEDAYVANKLTAAERKAYDKESQASGDSASSEIDKKVPPILTTLFASPYILGPELIKFLDASGGWDAINEALKTPPTEEAMFDPTTYQTDAAKQQTVEIKAPKGAETIENSEFGPTAWYLLLASRLDPQMALAATDGWGGDRYVVYRQDGKVCLNATVQGDTPDDVDQMAKALGAWAAKSPKGTAEVNTSDGAVQFHSCDPGKDAKAVGGKVTPDLLALPVTRTQLYTQATEAKRSPKQARCFANGVVERFTLAQIQDPDGTFIQSADGQRILQELRSTCFS